MARKKTVDRRLQRTRALLQGALNAMITEKGYEATTVQDIIDRANVGRSTFYAHFADKESLLFSGIEDLRTFLRQQQSLALAASGAAHERGFGFSLAMFEHAKGHAPLYRAMVGKQSGAVVTQRISTLIVDLVRDDLTALGYKATPSQRDLIAQHVGGGFMGVLTWWVDHGVKLPPHEVNVVFRRLAMDGLDAELKRNADPRRPT